MKRRAFVKAMAAGAAVPVAALGDDQEFHYAVDPTHPEVLPVIRFIGDLGEPVKAMTVFRDSVIIVTEYGKVFRVTMEDMEIIELGHTDWADGPPTEWIPFMKESDRRF